MNGLRREDHRVLAIDPMKRGFGFAVLEGAGSLIDWGTRETSSADEIQALRQAVRLLEQYGPDTVVVEDTRDPLCRRRVRARTLIEKVSEQAILRGIAVDRVPRTRVLHVFVGAGASNKVGIAEVIAEHFSELEPRVPPTRKPWMSEDTRTSIFDAVALALVYYLGDPEFRASSSGDDEGSGAQQAL